MKPFTNLNSYEVMALTFTWVNCSPPSICEGLFNMSINQLALTLGRDHCRSERCCGDTCSLTDRQGNWSGNSLSVPVVPNVPQPQSQASTPLSSRVAKNYAWHLFSPITVHCWSWAVVHPLSPRLVPLSNLFSPAVLLGDIVPATLVVLSHSACPRISAHYANRQTS